MQYLDTGENALLIFLEVAKSSVEGLGLYGELEELRQSCEQELVLSNGNERPAESENVSLARQLFGLHHFDLGTLVEQFLDRICESQGLAVFALPCDYPDFHDIFSNRIHYEFS